MSKPFVATRKCPYCTRKLGEYQYGEAHPQCIAPKKKKVKFNKFKLHGDSYPTKFRFAEGIGKWMK